MFHKKCPRCARKIQKDFDFCPYCGMDFRLGKRIDDEKDYGMLGKDDLVSSFPQFGMQPGFQGLFNSILKEVEKSFGEIDKNSMQDKKDFKKIKPGNNISISISTNLGRPEIRVNNQRVADQEIKELKIRPEISEEDGKAYSKLPRKEAEAKVRRMSNKVVYEIKLPGVKNIKDVVINKLENSIEIKAFTKESVYFKLLPINLPILNYKLKDEKLVLELKT